jgi:hypothetical protein
MAKHIACARGKAELGLIVECLHAGEGLETGRAEREEQLRLKAAAESIEEQI